MAERLSQGEIKVANFSVAANHCRRLAVIDTSDYFYT
jgi:hypothetical protein